MFFYRFGSRNCGFAVPEASLNSFQVDHWSEDLYGDPDISSYLQQALKQGFQEPDTWQAASELFITLKGIAAL